MAKSYEKKIVEFKNESANTALQTTQEGQNEQAKALTYKMLGAITAMDALARSFSASMSSQALRGLEKIEQEKLYLSLGYETFVEFLNSDDSPVTKSQYYERIKLLNSEGDQLYDTLSQLSFPVSKRKLLGKGAIAVEGETVIVTTDDGEQQIELSDRNRLLQTISALADQNADKSKKLDKQTAELEKSGEKLKKKDEEIERLKASKAVAPDSTHSRAVMNLISAFGVMVTEAESLSPIEKAQFAPRTFELIAQLRDRLATAYRVEAIDLHIARANGDGHTAFDEELNDEELMSLMD